MIFYTVITTKFRCYKIKRINYILIQIILTNVHVLYYKQWKKCMDVWAIPCTVVFQAALVFVLVA